MMFIPLPNNEFAVADSEDYDRCMKYKWYSSIPGKGRSPYVATRIFVFGVKHTMKMHRFIMGVKNPDIHIDHINHFTCDNRKSDLKECSHRQNASNRNKSVETSRFRGVCFEQHKKRWRACIRINKRFIHIGYFKSELEAKEAYATKSSELLNRMCCV